MEEILRTLVGFRSVSQDHTANAEALEYVTGFLEKRSMYMQHFVIEDAPALVATTRNTKTPAVMLAAHIDVIPAPDELFELQQSGDKYYGRGVYDMKFAIAAYLQLVDDLKDELGEYDFGIMITSDEELNGHGTRALVEKGFVPKVCVLPDGGHDWQLETLAKGFMHAVITTEGETAHGSRPWEGDSASLKMIDLLHEIRRDFADQSAGTSTLNVGILQGGKAVNQIPDEMRAELDFRFLTTAEMDETKATLDTLCAKYDATFTVQSTGTPSVNDIQNPYLQTFTKIVKDATGRECSGVTSYGASDARFFSAAGVPCIVTRPPGGGHHADNEWLSQSGFIQLHDILHGYLEQAARHDAATSAASLTSTTVS